MSKFNKIASFVDNNPELFVARIVEMDENGPVPGKILWYDHVEGSFLAREFNKDSEDCIVLWVQPGDGAAAKEKFCIP